MPNKSNDAQSVYSNITFMQNHAHPVRTISFADARYHLPSQKSCSILERTVFLNIIKEVINENLFNPSLLTFSIRI